MTVQDLSCCLQYRVIMIIKIEPSFLVNSFSVAGPIKGQKYLNKTEAERCRFVVLLLLHLSLV